MNIFGGLLDLKICRCGAQNSVVENVLRVLETAQDCLEYRAEKRSSPLNVELLSCQNQEQAIINLQ